MGLLGEIYSFGNRTRNKLRGLLDDPKGYLQQTADQTANTLRDMTGANETAQQFALRDKINAGDQNALEQYRNLEKTIQNKLFDVALNFNPAAVGTILKSGNVPKNALYPEEFKASINRSAKFDPTENMDAAGNLWNTGQQAQIRQLNDGNYLLVSSPVWPNKGAGKYAVGDSIAELQQYAAKQGAHRESGRAGAESRTLLGKLKKEYGDDAFSTAKSTQSNSQYITHIPSGTKIRISDHDLPLHYEQPDLDLRSAMSIQDQLKAIGGLLK